MTSSLPKSSPHDSTLTLQICNLNPSFSSFLLTYAPARCLHDFTDKKCWYKSQLHIKNPALYKKYTIRILAIGSFAMQKYSIIQYISLYN